MKQFLTREDVDKILGVDPNERIPTQEEITPITEEIISVTKETGLDAGQLSKPEMINEKDLMENEVINLAVEGLLNDENYDQKNEKMKTHYEKLRKKVDSTLDNIKVPPIIKMIILSAPDLFYLVWKLTFDPEIKGKHKRKMAYALLYFVAPFDIVPDFILGIGVVDDVIVVCYALNSILNEVDPIFLEKYWLGDNNLLEIIQTILREIDNIRKYFIDYIKNPFHNFMKDKNVDENID
ncbi:YkvA family protein [Fusibacter sp. 3D3]|uniref:YkvA family protein n=1 Tax=Fusibacter sp. 3D3 TaxID=1048380 RepID=UPI000853D2AB|nr:DUF1232 domain-containing protein [Fusibacter sp. 3D3]GAU78569.1 conserved protein [Fusibacter sp. 3D3]